MLAPLYELIVDKTDTVRMTASQLIDTWRDTNPEAVGKALDLQPGASVVIHWEPPVVVRRIL